MVVKLCITFKWQNVNTIIYSTYYNVTSKYCLTMQLMKNIFFIIFVGLISVDPNDVLKTLLSYVPTSKTPVPHEELFQSILTHKFMIYWHQSLFWHIAVILIYFFTLYSLNIVKHLHVSCPHIKACLTIAKKQNGSLIYRLCKFLLRSDAESHQQNKLSRQKICQKISTAKYVYWGFCSSVRKAREKI